jgi:hypothetical protein
MKGQGGEAQGVADQKKCLMFKTQEIGPGFPFSTLSGNGSCQDVAGFRNTEVPEEENFEFFEPMVFDLVSIYYTTFFWGAGGGNDFISLFQHTNHAY